MTDSYEPTRAELEQIAVDFKAANPFGKVMDDPEPGYARRADTIYPSDLERYYAERGHAVRVELDWGKPARFVITPVVRRQIGRCGLSARKVDE